MGGVPLIDTNRELIKREQECAVLDALVDRLRDGGGTVVVRRADGTRNHGRYQADRSCPCNQQ
jgi:hypothetical protein